jgi:hypothetical protein
MHELTHAELVADEFVDAAAKRLAHNLQLKEKELLRRVVLRIFDQNIVAFRPQAVATVNIPADPAELCSWANILDRLFGVGVMQIRELSKIARIELERQKDLQKVLALIFHAMRV